MKKICFLLTAFCPVFALFAQQNQGTIIYERTMQMQLEIDDHGQQPQSLPRTITDRFELIYGDNKSIWKHLEEENSEEGNGNGMQIRMITPGQDDILFCNFNNATTTEQREMFDRKFIITDSIHKLSWKVGEESQIIMGHVCRKATAQKAGKRTQMTMDNGNMERKETADTFQVIAWFTTDIPVAAGPDMQGQLPGLILLLDANNGRMVYKAVEFSANADMAAIKEPTRGKKVTPKQYAEETVKMMDEMKKNNHDGGNRRIIRMN